MFKFENQERFTIRLRVFSFMTEHKKCVCEAARCLGSIRKTLVHGRRKRRKVWTGFIDGQRTWVGRRVILRDGTHGKIQKVLRGRATVMVHDPDGTARSVIVNGLLLKLWKSSVAVLLGQQKLGLKETPSASKIAAVRANGRMPVRPGHRKRGRPRKDSRPWQQYVLSPKCKPREFMSVSAMIVLAARQHAEIKLAVEHATLKDAARERREKLRKQLLASRDRTCGSKE